MLFLLWERQERYDLTVNHLKTKNCLDINEEYSINYTTISVADKGE